MEPVQIVDDIVALRVARAGLTGSVGLVPTMGALHAGHLALVQQAVAENDTVIATIFVNPTQFNNPDDLDVYPRDLQQDVAMLVDAGVDIVFTPTPEIMYPPGFQTYVIVENVTQGLEGAQRPGHFRGVATVVAKLLNLTQPDRAYFGQKDAQQVAVIRQMVVDLNFPLAIVVCPTAREADGLALSSRNRHLSPDQRKAAPVLYRALQATEQAFAAGVYNPNELRGKMQAVLAAEPLAQVDYVSVADAQTLQELSAPIERPALVSLAVTIGHTRLIDNTILGP